jgi:serine/threonine-protein kinase HipA
MEEAVSEELHVLADGRIMGRIEARRQRFTFCYDEGWRAWPRAYPLSLSMPFVVAEHEHKVVEAFLWGLLPDNETILTRWGRKFQVSPRNAFALISHVGEDCAGAVQFVRGDRIKKMSAKVGSLQVRWLTADETAERLRLLVEDASATRTGEEGQFSLAGAQPKTALFHDAANRRWGVPQGRTPTTHILKPATGEFEGFTQNEHFCLQLARSIGLPATNSWVEDFRELPVIVVERYDRVVRKGQVRRTHQEDMCQALGVRPQIKYQNQGGPSPKMIAELLWDHSSSAANDVRRFADALIFNWLMVGTDAHAKNYSLLLAPDQGLHLAPLYDLASAIPYPRQVDPRKAKLAMKVGGHYRARDISRRDWERCARDLRLRPSDLFASLEAMMSRLVEAAPAVASEMEKAGLRHPAVALLVDALPSHLQGCAKQLVKSR